MIYPTRPAIVVAAAGVPVTLVVAVLLPEHWYAGLAWPLAVLSAAIVDAVLGPGPRKASMTLALPRHASVGRGIDANANVQILAPRGPRTAEIALAPGNLLVGENDGSDVVSLERGCGPAKVALRALRRGTAQIDRAWLRWRGPLGLIWKQRDFATDNTVAILPDIQPLYQRGARIFERKALAGMISQRDRGEGTDFDALVEFRSGMDRRAIDWKQSARHRKLHGKEFRTERNNQIVFVLDAGRQMCEPVAGLPRIDRAISAALLTAWVALKLGDRVALQAFDSRPRIASGFVSGSGAFAALQGLAAKIDYSLEEANYSFALITLGARLTRRSMVVFFTEFSDAVSAELMVRAAAHLMRTHLLLVVMLRDEELETIVDREPEQAEDIPRAITAAALLRQRQLVINRLRQLGAYVVVSEHDKVGERLAEAYLDLKRKDLL